MRDRDRLTDLGVSYVIHSPRLPGGEGGDVLNERTCRETTEFGGPDRIPSLVDTAREETLYESDDVVEYLDEHDA